MNRRAAELDRGAIDNRLRPARDCLLVTTVRKRGQRRDRQDNEQEDAAEGPAGRVSGQSMVWRQSAGIIAPGGRRAAQMPQETVRARGGLDSSFGAIIVRTPSL